MRMNKGAILASMAIIALASVFAGAGTMAYFNDNPQATGNTFTAGNLDVKLWDGDSWEESLSGFWVSPSQWAPGETFTRRLHFKNFGSVDVKVLLLDFKSYVGTPYSFWNVIEVVTFTEHIEGETINYAEYIAAWPDPNYGDHAAPLTLHELIIGVPDGTTGYLDNSEYLLYDTFRADTDADGYNEFGGAYLAAGAQGWIELGFKFSEDADNTYQDATCSFDLGLLFLSGPEYIDKDELPGFVG